MKTVIEMAREAKLIPILVGDHKAEYFKLIERFAALVREDERDNSDLTLAYMTGYEKGKDAGALIEREACAKVCEEYGESVNNEWNKQLGVADDLVGIADECAAAIRARGEK